MSMSISTEFLTLDWKSRRQEVSKCLEALLPLCPSLERCHITVGEAPDDGEIHVSLFRSVASWTMTGWTASKAEPPRAAKYYRRYDGDVSPETIRDDITRLLKSPRSGQRKRRPPKGSA